MIGSMTVLARKIAFGSSLRGMKWVSSMDVNESALAATENGRDRV